jgi:hypothetical protein
MDGRKRGGFCVTAAAIAALCVGACGAYAQKSAGTVNAKTPEELVPAGYEVVSDYINGDLNKDGLEDVVLYIQNKRKKNLYGIIIAFNKGGGYEVALEKRNFFSYDDEDTHYAREPDEYAIGIEKGILTISTGGKSSCCTFEESSYKFRYQNGDFELIGYDRVVTVLTSGVIRTAESVNLLSKKMQIKTNKAANVEDDDGAESGKEVFDEVWKNITVKKKPLTLRNIKNFRDDGYYYINEE